MGIISGGFFEEKIYIVNWFYSIYNMGIAEMPRTGLQLIELLTNLKRIKEVDASVGICGTRISVLTVSPESTIISYIYMDVCSLVQCALEDVWMC